MSALNIQSGPSFSIAAPARGITALATPFDFPSLIPNQDQAFQSGPSLPSPGEPPHAEAAATKLGLLSGRPAQTIDTLGRVMTGAASTKDAVPSHLPLTSPTGSFRAVTGPSVSGPGLTAQPSGICEENNNFTAVVSRPPPPSVVIDSTARTAFSDADVQNVAEPVRPRTPLPPAASSAVPSAETGQKSAIIKTLNASKAAGSDFAKPRYIQAGTLLDATTTLTPSSEGRLDSSTELSKPNPGNASHSNASHSNASHSKDPTPFSASHAAPPAVPTLPQPTSEQGAGGSVASLPALPSETAANQAVGLPSGFEFAFTPDRQRADIDSQPSNPGSVGQTALFSKAPVSSVSPGRATETAANTAVHNSPAAQPAAGDLGTGSVASSGRLNVPVSEGPEDPFDSSYLAFHLRLSSASEGNAPQPKFEVSSSQEFQGREGGRPFQPNESPLNLNIANDSALQETSYSVGTAGASEVYAAGSVAKQAGNPMPPSPAGESAAPESALAGSVAALGVTEAPTISPGLVSTGSPSTISNSQPILSQDSLPGGTKPSVKELNLKLGAEGGETINVRLTERQGQVQVSVRSSDPKLAASLKQDLSDLTGSLDKAGLKSDRTWSDSSVASNFARGFGTNFSEGSQRSHSQESSEHPSNSGNDGQQNRRNQPDSSNQQNRQQRPPNDEWATAEELSN